jgi:ribulose 1,5-bisphosphate synthetase/thiazole synthase
LLILAFIIIFRPLHHHPLFLHFSIMEIDPAVTFKWDGKVTHAKRPKVLIVGAGLGGLTLAMILQKSDTPYEIFERATGVQSFGMGRTGPSSHFFFLFALIVGAVDPCLMRS